MASKLISRAPRMWNHSVGKPRLALISGAASPMGIGRATSIAMVEEGANVVVTDVKARETEGMQLVEQLNELGKSNGTGASAMWHELDVTKESQWHEAIAAAESHFGGPLDVSFLNAGIGGEPSWGSLLEDHPTEAYDRVIAVNQTGVYYGLKASVKSMAKRDASIKEAASVIVTASVAGASGTLGPFAYSMSKAAVISLTKWAAVDLGGRNIRVNCIQPGAINTNIFDPMRSSPQADAAMVAVAKMEPLAQRMAEPSEMAKVVLFLGSNESSYLTGAAIAADGGLLAVNGLRSGLLGVSRPEYA